MIDYYYLDLYFDPRKTGFEQTVRACINGIIRAGGQYQRLLIADPETKRSVVMGTQVTFRPEDIPLFAAAYAEDVRAEGMSVISFPPLGRVMFTYPFHIDEDLADELHEEEEDAHSKATDMGLAFTYTASQAAGEKIKASFSFWEEYVLVHGSTATHIRNIKRVIGMIGLIAEVAEPYFGAMNNELHIDTDRSLNIVEQGGVPDGNEFVYVGRALLNKLDVRELRRYGIRHAALRDGSVIIQVADKWQGHSAV